MRGRRGAILIYVLGVITLLSVIVTEFLMEAAVAMRYRSQMAGRQDLEIFGYSALETSLAVLAEIKLLDKGLYSPAQGWGNPIAYAKMKIPSGYTVNVKINDETGKLSIYDENLNDFGNLLNEIGVSYEKIENIKSEIKKYLDRDKKNNKKEEKKKEQILFSLNQLKDIPVFEKAFFDAKGNPNSLFQILKDNVSVFNMGKVNINTAAPLVKKLHLGIGGLGPKAEGKKFVESMDDIGRSSKDTQFGFKSSVFDIEIEVARGPVKYHLSAILEDKSAQANGVEKQKNDKEKQKPEANAMNGKVNASENAQAQPRRNISGKQTNAAAPTNLPEHPGMSAGGPKPSQTVGAQDNKGSLGKKDENKSDFVFLALTQDDSLVN